MRYLIILILMPFIQYVTRTGFRFVIPGTYQFWQTYCFIFIQHVASIGIPMLVLYRKKTYYMPKEKSAYSPADLFRYILLGVCLQMIGTALNFPVSMLLQHFGHNLPAALPNPVNGWEFILQTIVVCFVPAILEELLFRQIIYNKISQYSKRSAIFFSAMFFSMAHFDFFNLAATFFIGITLGILRSCNVSLLHCCIIHFIVNLTASILNLGFNFPMFSELFHRYYPLLVFLSLTLFFTVFPKGQAKRISTVENEERKPKKHYTALLLKQPLFYIYCILFFIIGVK